MSWPSGEELRTVFFQSTFQYQSNNYQTGDICFLRSIITNQTRHFPNLTNTETLSPQIEAGELNLGILKAGEYELAAAIKCDHFWSFQQYAYIN